MAQAGRRLGPTRSCHALGRASKCRRCSAWSFHGITGRCANSPKRPARDSTSASMRSSPILFCPRQRHWTFRPSLRWHQKLRSVLTAGDACLREVKFDEYRCLLHKAGDGTVIFSSNLLQWPSLNNRGRAAAERNQQVLGYFEQGWRWTQSSELLNPALVQESPHLRTQSEYFQHVWPVAFFLDHTLTHSS